MASVDLGDDTGPDGRRQGSRRNAEEGQHAVVGNLAQAPAKSKVFPEFLDALRSIDVDAENRKHLLYGVLCSIL